MPWRLLAFCILFLHSSVVAEPSIKRITFHTVPDDAQVFLEVGTAKPYLLGTAGQELPLDLTLFDGRRDVRVTFRREGWLEETRVLQQQPVQSRYFDTRDRYPEAGQGPVRLTARDDFTGRRIQVIYYLSKHAFPLTGLGLLAVVGVGWAWRRRRESAVQLDRTLKLDSLMASLDQGDSYAGRILGGYRMMERIGTGGMSLVYRAVRNDTLEDEVAIKLLDPKVAESPDSIKRFKREIQICRSLSHPNVLQIHDFGEQDGLWFLVLELLKGHTLSSELDKGIMDRKQVAAFLAPIVEALDYLHSKGIVHRDLKPENIFVLDNGRVKLMDFGIARGSQFTVATATHQGLGTPAYMSPEQVEGRFSEASDQYSLGCIVYEMLSGAPPFNDPDPYTLAFKHVGETPAPLQGVKDELNLAVMTLLAKQPEHRYSSIKEAGRALLSACQ